jgi:putative ABC transport system permease protein
MSIVGVIGDVKQLGLDSNAKPEVYFPYSQVTSPQMSVAVRTTTSDPLGLVAGIKAQIQTIDKDLPLDDAKTMQQLLAESVSGRRFNMLLLAVFAGVALALALVGIYGVMSYAVSQRTQEIGIRMALGARAADVLKLVVINGMSLALIGVAVGLAGAFALTRLLSSLLFQVTPTDRTTFAGVAICLIVVALVACFVPARRATKVDPLVALRNE